MEFAAYLFELGYDLALSREFNVSKSPGFEGFGLFMNEEKEDTLMSTDRLQINTHTQDFIKSTRPSKIWMIKVNRFPCHQCFLCRCVKAVSPVIAPVRVICQET